MIRAALSDRSGLAGPDGKHPAPAPCSLPGDVAGFTGRERQVEWLHRLATPDRTSTAAVIGLLSGAPGVGKTALAVHWAHRTRAAFPDGQLYVNLRGYDPEQPMTAGEALAHLLAALGLRGPDIPLDVDDRSARYRSELAGRRMLIVLDNAATAEQVRPLLPGTPACVTLVTSRDALPGLVARHGAHRLVLDTLPAADARTLLRRLIGPQEQVEHQAVATLAELCGRMPLALRLVAELAVARPHHSPTVLAAELADRRRRLDLLDGDADTSAGVRAVISWSCQRLPAHAARAFRSLALHPGADWDPYAAAALTGTPVGTARRLLDRLARAHLVQPTGPDRYTMHDLLRAYGAELAAATDPEPDRHAALTRLFDHYLATATTATATLGLPAVDRRPRPFRFRQVAPAPPVGDPDTARAWLNAERANLVTVCAHTAGHGWREHAARLAAVLFGFLLASGHYTESLTLHTHARRAACTSGDPHSEAYALTSLGFVHWRRGSYPDARAHHRLALDRFRQAGDRTGEAFALLSLGLVHMRQGKCRRAAEHCREALRLFEQLGERRGQAYGWTALGLACLRQEDGRQALEYQHRALDLFERLGNPFGMACTLTNLGLAHCRQGHYQQAVECHRRSLDYARQIGHRTTETEALNGLGEALQASGRAVQAGARHTDALAVAERIGERYEQARAHQGIAVAHHTTGDFHRARRHWENALQLHTELGVPDGEALAARWRALARPR
ncbi:hypothetical protein GCM10010145_58490 [Streptomyces ruber]|uniref:Uncharacterized protein n=2 Tax=Streptomyces TaxID=1883 RepID=A0A918BPX4_9ACTN|nr:tetratricopeptide repeat protein [Streptomyces ruber]GGQ81064.1 hypothetical protein GCM10010145_58490 [Streptomyces ruber]